MIVDGVIVIIITTNGCMFTEMLDCQFYVISIYTIINTRADYNYNSTVLKLVILYCGILYPKASILDLIISTCILGLTFFVNNDYCLLS